MADANATATAIPKPSMKWPVTQTNRRVPTPLLALFLPPRVIKLLAELLLLQFPSLIEYDAKGGHRGLPGFSLRRHESCCDPRQARDHLVQRPCSCPAVAWRAFLDSLVCLIPLHHMQCTSSLVFMYIELHCVSNISSKVTTKLEGAHV